MWPTQADFTRKSIFDFVNSTRTNHTKAEIEEQGCSKYLIVWRRWDEAIEAVISGRTMSLIVFHQRKIQLQFHLMIQIPVQAGNQLDVSRITDLQTHVSVPTSKGNSEFLKEKGIFQMCLLYEEMKQS
jgi:hypothetical protein